MPKCPKCGVFIDELSFETTRDSSGTIGLDPKGEIEVDYAQSEDKNTKVRCPVCEALLFEVDYPSDPKVEDFLKQDLIGGQSSTQVKP